MPPRRILVTGGAGFIGSHLARRLAAGGHEVHVLHRPGGDLARLGGDLAALRRWACDLADASGLAAVITGSRPDAVFHLAGDTRLRHLDAELSGVLPSLDRNVRGTLDVVLAANAARVPLLIRVGGLEEYGRGPVPYVETQREEPVSPYSASQVAATHYLRMLAPHLACRAVTVRPALVYGPAQSPSFLIPSLIEHCFAGRDFTIRAKGHARDLLYVDDLVDALLLTLDAPLPAGDIVNVGSGHEVTMGDVAAAVVRLTGASIRLLDAPEGPGPGLPHLYASHAKATAVLGWRPRIGLEEGLARTIDAFRRMPA